MTLEWIGEKEDGYIEAVVYDYCLSITRLPSFGLEVEVWSENYYRRHPRLVYSWDEAESLALRLLSSLIQDDINTRNKALHAAKQQLEVR